MVRYLFSGLLIFTLPIGCAHHKRAARPLAASALPADEAPRFDLSIDGKPAISTVSHRIEPDIQIEDARAAIEKSYYPGQTDPHHWRDALTVIPMEAFQPAFDKQLRKAVVDSLDDPLKYGAIKVRVVSCFATLDTRRETELQLQYNFQQWDEDQDQQDRRLDEQERKQAKAEREARRVRKSIGIPSVDGSQDDEFGSAVGRLLWKAAIVTPVRALSRRRQQSRQLQALPQTLPSEFTSESTEGWNCNIELEATFVDSGSKQTTVSVLARKHLEEDPSVSAKDQCQAIVLSTVDEIRQQLRQKRN